MTISDGSKSGSLTPSPPPPVSDCPAHLAFNPSRWRSRSLILVFAAAGFCIAVYLALYQWGVLSTVWEPFFGDGSERVLHSFVSRLLPVPDAFLGALGYVADIVTGSVGGSVRWRTRPWIVLIYGATVTVVGAIALALALLQPLLFHTACTLCLVSSLLSLCVVCFARHEVLSSLHYLRRVATDIPFSQF